MKLSDELREMATRLPTLGDIDRALSAADLLDEAERALEFYADEGLDGYDVQVTDYGLSTENGPIIEDAGERARATLAKVRGQAWVTT